MTYTISDAKRLFFNGVSTKAIRRLIESGRLRAIDVGDRYRKYLITDEAIREFFRGASDDSHRQLSNGLADQLWLKHFGKGKG